MLICYVFQFGDLIAIEVPSDGKALPIYIQWVVYVGKGQVKGLKPGIKSADEDIFYVYGKQTYSRLQDFIYSVKNLLFNSFQTKVHIT